MVERLLLDRIDAITARPAVGLQHDPVALAGAHEAEAALALEQLAGARADVALDAPLPELAVEAVPVAGGDGVAGGGGARTGAQIAAQVAHTTTVTAPGGRFIPAPRRQAGRESRPEVEAAAASRAAIPRASAPPRAPAGRRGRGARRWCAPRRRARRNAGGAGWRRRPRDRRRPPAGRRACPSRSCPAPSRGPWRWRRRGWRRPARRAPGGRPAAWPPSRRRPRRRAG